MVLKKPRHDRDPSVHCDLGRCVANFLRMVPPLPDHRRAAGKREHYMIIPTGRCSTPWFLKLIPIQGKARRVKGHGIREKAMALPAFWAPALVTLEILNTYN